ncbi:MAG: hypothetical protein IPK94_08430 [Saprospiraceae bacterium]|nr:hypothetical protein [Saprospiraceae bacterium]
MEQPGTWVLAGIRYIPNIKPAKTTANGFIQTPYMNEADQVDRVIMYLDRVPIMAAQSK